jgi:dTDP-4-dehydrorhamnose 3,5-epimerase
MKIIEAQPLAIPEVHVVRFARFADERGYFTETFRRSDVESHEGADFLRGLEFVQMNESVSRPGVVRGLHFQWNPYMGKLVRTISGRMVDLVLDIRVGSPTFGKLLAHDMPAHASSDSTEWIWVPPGFAHGNFFTEETAIEYLCTGEYSPGCEAAVSPFADDIDWSLAPPDLRDEFERIVADGPLVSDKDRGSGSFAEWAEDERSENFRYDELLAAL